MKIMKFQASLMAVTLTSLLLPILTQGFILGKSHSDVDFDTVLRYINGHERSPDQARKVVVASQPWGSSPLTKYNEHCHDLACPYYDVVSDEKDYEVRLYNTTKWVCTGEAGVDFGQAQDDMFTRLFDYISGENEQKEKVEMTAPVKTRIIPGQGPACANNFTMCFFVSPNAGVPPAPSDSRVYLTPLGPKQHFFVRSFGGRAKQSDWLKEATILGSALQKDGISYIEDYYYIAGYDSPFTLFNRHNEIWFLPA